MELTYKSILKHKRLIFNSKVHSLILLRSTLDSISNETYLPYRTRDVRVTCSVVYSRTIVIQGGDWTLITLRSVRIYRDWLAGLTVNEWMLCVAQLELRWPTHTFSIMYIGAYLYPSESHWVISFCLASA